MNIVHTGRLKHLEFTLATGDIFDTKVDAIVSSEQTDFVLSGNLESLSGQIWSQYGDLVQRELNAATGGQVLGPGTVIDTSGRPDFERIFHAGFHDPDDWPDLPSDGLATAGEAQSEFRQTNYFAAIGSCITQILRTAMVYELKSVAFPLIGCGIFGLDVKMLILQFLDAVEEFDGQLTEGEELHVWLVIRDSNHFESAAGTFLDLLLQARSKMVSVPMEQTGVPILDRFARRVTAPTNEDWAKWQLCRYAEIAIEFMCYGLSRAIRPLATPESMFEENRAPTFGLILEKAKHLARSSKLENRAWGACFFGEILQDRTSTDALDAINQVRNNLAHGRQSLPLSKIEQLLRQGLHLDAWQSIAKTDGELRLTDWRPWVWTSPNRGDRAGLFERWQKNCIQYLVPETGEIFKEQRN